MKEPCKLQGAVQKRFKFLPRDHEKKARQRKVHTYSALLSSLIMSAEESKVKSEKGAEEGAGTITIRVKDQVIWRKK